MPKDGIVTLGSAQTRGLSLCTSGAPLPVSLRSALVQLIKETIPYSIAPSVTSWRSSRTSALLYPPLLAKEAYHC